MIYLVKKEKLQHLGAPDRWAVPHQPALPTWLNKRIPGLLAGSLPLSLPPSLAGSLPAAEARPRDAAAPHTLRHHDGEGGRGEEEGKKRRISLHGPGLPTAGRRGKEAMKKERGPGRRSLTL